MIAIVCVDDRMGMAFHQRRLSQDRLLRSDLIARLSGKNLWMNPYSFKQFEKEDLSGLSLQVKDFSPEDIPAGDYCLIETFDPALCRERIERLFLYRWNRAYPADTFFTLSLADFRQSDTFSFRGSSHEEITLEVYTK